MATATDLLLDDSGDLAISAAGDLLAGESDQQHVELLLRTSQGEWRQSPLVGIGLVRYLLAPYGSLQAAALSREVAVQLEQDGYQVLQLDLQDLSAAIINAERP